MIKSLSVCSLLPVTLRLIATCSFVSLALAQQLTCQSNGCDGSCTTSNACGEEHILLIEHQQCSNPLLSPLLETPLLPGLQQCTFDILTLEFESCPNSHVDDRTKSVGYYGKPNWVGAEFQSLNYDSFSMTVMWEHADAEILSSFPDLSPVQGYEIRIYEKEAGKSEVLQQCFCVTDPSMRNISDIRNVFFTYKEMSHMIVEVRSFPSLIGENDSNTRRNCSLLTGCSTTEDCLVSHDDCYSWPQNCLNFLPYYDPLTCAPPLYSPPVNVIAEISLVDDNVANSVFGKLNLSWEPPRMNYELFPVPNIYYITIESAGSNLQFIKAVETTNVTILHLNSTSVYHIFVRAYVPCSGLGWTIWQSSAGCGLFDTLGTKVTVVEDCAPPSPPLHGWLGNYQSTSLHSTVTFQCDSGWSPDELLTTTCKSTNRLEWVPNPANHTCSDIDECLEGNHNCSEYADCENKYGGFNCKCYTGFEGDGMTCKLSSGVIIGTLTIIGLIAALALFLFVIRGIYFFTRAWCTTQTSSVSNPSPKMTTTSANLSHGEFTGEGECIKTSANSCTNGKFTL